MPRTVLLGFGMLAAFLMSSVAMAIDPPSKSRTGTTHQFGSGTLTHR